MGSDKVGLIIALIGVVLFICGFFALVDVLYFDNFKQIQNLPYIYILAPNITYAGYGLIEVGRYISTDGETKTSKYFSKRVTIPTPQSKSETTTTKIWGRILVVAVVLQLVHGLVGFSSVPLTENILFRAGEYMLIISGVVTIYYDLEHISAQTHWNGHTRWVVGMAIFPINLITLIVYLYLRSEKEIVEETEDIKSVYTWNHTQTAIVICIVGWASIMALDSVTVSRGGLIGLTVVLIWLLLPTLLWYDIQNNSTEVWNPRTRLWIIASIIPAVNIASSVLYLVRRSESS